MKAASQTSKSPFSAFAVMDEAKFRKLFSEFYDPFWNLSVYQMGDRHKLDGNSVTLLDPVLAIEPHFTSNKTIVLLDNSDVNRMIKVMDENDKVNHVFCVSGKYHHKQLLSIMNQLVQPTGQPFLHTELREEMVSRFSQKAHVLSCIKKYVSSLGSFEELPTTAATIASELIMNATFDAPFDKATGMPKYDSLPRNQELQLTEAEKFSVRYGFDGHSLIISVKDHCGTLSREKIVRNLFRCSKKSPNLIKQPPGGAGVGLYLILNLCTRLDFYLHPETSTEVVAYICASKRQKEYELQGSAINIFVSE